MTQRQRNAAAAFCVGAIAALGQSPFGVWGATILALAALFWAIARQTQPQNAALIGWVGGAGYFCLSLSWIVSSFFVDGAFCLADHGIWVGLILGGGGSLCGLV